MRGVMALPIAGAVVALVACAHASAPGIAERVTGAIYNNDPGAVRRMFTETVRPTVTDESVAALSAIMHGFGVFEYTEPVSKGPQPRRYDFEAQFSYGSMLLQLKLDPDGAISGYRVIPNKL